MAPQERQWPPHRPRGHRIESLTRLGCHGWVVERTVSWLAGCRRLHRRYERKAEHFLAFGGMAAALIGYRRPGAVKSLRGDGVRSVPAVPSRSRAMTRPSHPQRSLLSLSIKNSCLERVTCGLTYLVAAPVVP